MAFKRLTIAHSYSAQLVNVQFICTNLTKDREEY